MEIPNDERGKKGEPSHKQVSWKRKTPKRRNGRPGLPLEVQWLGLCLPVQGLRVRFPAGELGSHMPCSQNSTHKKKKKKRSKQCCNKFNKENKWSTPKKSLKKKKKKCLAGCDETRVINQGWAQRNWHVVLQSHLTPWDYEDRMGYSRGCTFFAQVMLCLNFVLPGLRREAETRFPQGLKPGLSFEVPRLMNPSMPERLVRGHATRGLPATHQQSPGPVRVLLPFLIMKYSQKPQ